MKKNLYIAGLLALMSVFNAFGVGEKGSNLKRFSSFFNIPDVQLNKKDPYDLHQSMRVFCQNNNINYDKIIQKDDESGQVILDELNSLSAKLGYTIRKIKDGQEILVVDISWPSIKNYANRVLAKYADKHDTPEHIKKLKKLLEDFGNISSESGNTTRTAIQESQASCLLGLCQQFFETPDADKNLIEGIISKAILNYTGFQRIMSILTVGLLNGGDDGFCPGFIGSKISMEDLSWISARGIYYPYNRRVALDPAYTHDLLDRVETTLVHELTHLFNYMIVKTEGYHTFYKNSIPFFVKSVLANDNFRDMFFPAISKTNLDPKNNAILKKIIETVRKNEVKFDRIKEVIKILSSGRNENVSGEEKKIFNILVEIVKHGFGEIVFGESWEGNMYDQLTPENFAVAVYIRTLLFQDSSGYSASLKIKWTNCEEILTMFGMLPFLYKDRYVILENRQNHFSFGWRELQREGEVTESAANVYRTHHVETVSLEGTLREMLNLPSAPGPFHYPADEYNKLRYPENPVHTDSNGAVALSQQSTFILPESYDDFLSKKIYNFGENFYDFFLPYDPRDPNPELNRTLGIGDIPEDEVNKKYNFGRTLLHRAVIAGRTDVVNTLLGMEADVDARDDDENTPIHYAAASGNLKMIEILREGGADIGIHNKDGKTPLGVAAKNRQWTVAYHLYEEIEKPTKEVSEFSCKKVIGKNIYDKEGRNLLHYVAMYGQVADVIRALCKKKLPYEINENDNHGHSPMYYAEKRKDEDIIDLFEFCRKEGATNLLHRATVRENKEIAKILLEEGADITVRDKYRRTALHYAEKSGNNEIIELLLEGGVKKGLIADTSNKFWRTPSGKTSLYYAVVHGQLAVAEGLEKLVGYFDQHNDYKDEDGNTLLHLAAEKGDVRMMNLLLKNGADIGASNKMRSTALHCAVKKKKKDAVEFLLGELGKPENVAKKRLINAVDTDEGTPLHYAVDIRNKEIIGLLLEKGADITVCSKKRLFMVRGSTALHCAIEEYDSGIFEFLLEKLKNAGKKELVNVIDREGNTPLYRVIGFNNEEAVKLLLGNGADVTIRNESGETALHRVAQTGNKGIMELLLTDAAGKGLVNAFDKSGHAPLHFAASTGDKKMIELLLKNGADITVCSKAGTVLHPVAYRSGDIFEFLFKKLGDEDGKKLVKSIDGRGDTLLHCVRSCNKKNRVDLLLKNGADVTVRNKFGWTPLYCAVRARDKEMMELLLKGAAGKKLVGVADRDGVTPLHLAVSTEDKEMVELLLRNAEKGLINTVVNAADRDGVTPLHLAVGTEDKEMVELLLRNTEKGLINTVVNAADKKGVTPLHLAADTGNKMVELLLENGADITVCSKAGTVLHRNGTIRDGGMFEFLLKKLKNAGKKIADLVNTVDEDGDTLLHRAVRLGNKKLIDFLLGNGANVAVQNKLGETVLHCAVYGSKEIIGFLLANAAGKRLVNVANKKGDTPVHLVARAGNKEIVELLLKEGADITARGENRRTALHRAAQSGSTEVVKSLLEKEADVTACDQNGLTALHYATQSWNVETVKFLLEKGAKMTARDNNGRTALHYASRDGDMSMVEFLIKEKGVKISICDKNGLTALHYAVQNRCRAVELIEFLMKNGADIAARDKNKLTALHYAVQNEYCTVELIESLLENGADIATCDQNGLTALHYAVQNRYCTVELIESLLENGANIAACDKNGLTALHHAVQNENNVIAVKMIEFLMKNGADTAVCDENGLTALHYAVRNRYCTVEMIEPLLKNGGAKVVAHILRYARKNGNDEVVNFLQEKVAETTD
ncbi:MAG: ankyrin repeat domain-containing protein [Holosporaceae bacterium]|jgi:serine/threonine-protein phosphatase 6 regulatory ankyrin repeat subunit B|nr:ankyrin repeat domain-containing protein [Holosporaceae bacterium]